MVKLLNKSTSKKVVKKDENVPKEPEQQLETKIEPMELPKIVASVEPAKLLEKVEVKPASIILPVETVIEPIAKPTVQVVIKTTIVSPREKPVIWETGPKKYRVMRMTKISLHGQICLYAQGDVICPSSYGPLSEKILLENLPLEEVKE